MGKKRASPGADIEKSPLQDVELSDEDAHKLQSIQRDIARTELVLGQSTKNLSIEASTETIRPHAERRAQEMLAGVYERRRAITKAIPKFWAVALMNNQLVSMHAQHQTDQSALSYLEDLWVARDAKEPRCYTIEFVSVHCL
jgi:template-activating factor I